MRFRGWIKWMGFNACMGFRMGFSGWDSVNGFRGWDLVHGWDSWWDSVNGIQMDGIQGSEFDSVDWIQLMGFSE